MHPNVARVVEAAAAAGLEIDVDRFPAGTRTADDAARAVGCDVSQIVKSLVFIADGSAVIALVSGANRVDPAKLASAVGAGNVRRADGDEARSATGVAIGGVPPFGHIRPVRSSSTATCSHTTGSGPPPDYRTRSSPSSRTPS
jgi:prolyl-tRNA editing enzyme YbaK/EbsC (Cys-tRNA(Pro) deacylase)